MGRRSLSRELYVAMNGCLVAKLTHRSAGSLRLAYLPEWLDSELATPISLSLPLSSEPFEGPVVSHYFDNLLPDSTSIRERMQRALGTRTAAPFDLLSAAGADCVGALQLSPTQDMSDVRTVEASPVEDADIADILRGYEQRPLGMTPGDDDFRVCIAGAQEKTALLLLDGHWHRPRRTTPTTHIFKLPIGVIDGHLDLSHGVENEWPCLAIAGAFGLPVANAQMQTFDGLRVLVVERFDREWSRDGSWIIRLPQEDLCQALGRPPALKYEADGGPGIVDCSRRSTTCSRCTRSSHPGCPCRR